MLKHIFSIVLLILCLSGLKAQSDSSVQAVDSQAAPTPELLPEVLEEEGGFSINHPRSTISSHLFYLQESSYQPELSAQTLNPEGRSEKELRDLAIKLKQIYDGAGYYVDPWEAPNDPDYVDSMGLARFRVFPTYPQIYVEKNGDSWQYSLRTLREIPAIHKTVFPYGADILVNLLPQSISRESFLGLALWQWLGLFILLIGAIVVHKVLYEVLAWLLRRMVPLISKRVNLSLEEVYPVARPLSVLLVLLLVIKFMPILQLSIGLGKPLGASLRILASIAGVWVAMRCIDLLVAIAHHLTDLTETNMDDQLVPLVSKIGKFIVVIFGLIFVLQNLGVNVTALLAGVSIGGLALALAAQDTVKNFIGSISIFVDRPFQVGDFIETSSLVGTVTEVGVRITRLRESGGAQVSIPNGTLANMTITNHGVRTYRRYVTSLTVTYGTQPDVMEKFVKAVQKIVVSHPDTWDEGHTVQFHQMSDSSLDIYMSIYFTTTAYDDWLKARQEVFLAIIKKAEELGVEFAFPSTSLYVESLPETMNKEEKS